MILDPVKILNKGFRIRSWILFGLVLVYISISLWLYFQWIGPSLKGSLDQHIAADSTTYLYFADSLREGRVDPYVIVALSSFPNTLWCPVLLALVLKSTFAMVLANYAMFFLALALLKRAYSFSAGSFLVLLLLNPTTTISLLSVNKEIVDLLVISIFFLGYRRRRHGLILFALALALFNRYEVCIVILVFLLAGSRMNPWRRRRVLTMVVLTIALSVMLPLFASSALASRFEEASEGGVIVWLDSLEMHYLYAVAVFPKIAQNLFGELVNWKALYDPSDIANSYIVFFNNIATMFVLAILLWKRTFLARFDLVYFAMLGCIITAVSLVIQPRYFYFVYVVLCLKAAQPRTEQAIHGLFVKTFSGDRKCLRGA